MELAILLITVFVLLVIGSPVTVAPGVGSLIFILMEGTPSVVVLHRMVSGIDSFPLIAVPFFILAGHLMNSAAILMIVASATIFAWILIDQQVAVILGDALLGFSQNKTVILIIIMLVVLLIGCFMETIAAITILVPVLLPIAEKVGIDPVHLGIIVILNLMLGLLTPPVGMVLYVLSKVSGVKFEKCVIATAPFIVPLLIVLAMITFFPDIAMWPPNVAYRGN
jgi:TRAP-type C4-dicarboxylate transport system permease large subunit